MGLEASLCGSRVHRCNYTSLMDLGAPTTQTPQQFPIAATPASPAQSYDLPTPVLTPDAALQLVLRMMAGTR